MGGGFAIRVRRSEQRQSGMRGVFEFLNSLLQAVDGRQQGLVRAVGGAISEQQPLTLIEICG